MPDWRSSLSTVYPRSQACGNKAISTASVHVRTQLKLKACISHSLGQEEKMIVIMITRKEIYYTHELYRLVSHKYTKA